MTDATKTSAEIYGAVANKSRNLIDVLYNAEKDYLEWQTYRAGRTNAEIGTALGITDAEVGIIDAAYAAGHAVYTYAANGVPAQSDYLYSLRVAS